MKGDLFDTYQKQYAEFVAEKVPAFVDAFTALIAKGGKNTRYFFAGNGASAAIASHLANDNTKALKLKASTFHDPALLTCFGNDYGYENWIAEAAKHYGSEGDVLVLISSSGTSKNILNGALAAKDLGMTVVSLTGPRPEPKLKEISDITLQVESEIYNVIECCHMIALCGAVDELNLVKLAK